MRQDTNNQVLLAARDAWLAAANANASSATPTATSGATSSPTATAGPSARET